MDLRLRPLRTGILSVIPHAAGQVMERWRQVTVDIEESRAELVADLLVEAGALGASIEDDETRGPAVEASGRAQVLAAFDSAQGLETRVAAALSELFGRLTPVPDAELSWTDVAPRDWSEAWKEGWEPQRLGQRLVIVPSWRSFKPESEDVVLELDPGMAFGTGTHETTRLCATALEELAAVERSMLDVGTGSGVLALFAAALGCAPVMAIDNDPDAVMIARQNAVANGLERRIRFAVTADIGIAGQYQLVVANILMQPLIALAERIASKVAPDGTLLLSGLLTEQLDPVARAYRARGMREQERRSEGEWGLLRLGSVHR